MEQQSNQDGVAVRFLTFANDKEDAEKAAKLREAASKIEQAIVKGKATEELIDYVPPAEGDEIDPTNDTRPLFERLLEQRTKKQEEIEESHKLSNLILKLDEEDARYLNEVARMKQEDEIKRRLEVYDALEEKKRQIQTRDLDEEEKRRKELLAGTKIGAGKPSIKSKLSSIIKVRPKSSPITSAIKMSISGNETTATKRLTPNDNPADATSKSNDATSSQTDDDQCKRLKLSPGEDSRPTETKAATDCTCQPRNVMKSIGVLPSQTICRPRIDSSDNSDQSDEEPDPRLIVGKVHKKRTTRQH